MHARVHSKTHTRVSLVALAWVSLTPLYGFMELALSHPLAYPTEFFFLELKVELHKSNRVIQ